MIVALLNQKGGVGKTTLATHIAGELAMRGQSPGEPITSSSTGRPGSPPWRAPRCWRLSTC